jgi:hypothetical protein
MTTTAFAYTIWTPVGGVDLWQDVEINDYPVGVDLLAEMARYEDVPLSAMTVTTQESLLIVDVDPPERTDMYDDDPLADVR